MPRGTWIYERTGGGGGGGPFVRTLLLKDATVANDIADHVPIFRAGPVVRVIGVLRTAITEDLVVRVNLNLPPDYTGGVELVVLTIPADTEVDHPVIETTFTPPSFPDLAVLSWDVVESDGQTNSGGIASITVQWQ